MKGVWLEDSETNERSVTDVADSETRTTGIGELTHTFLTIQNVSH